MSEIKTAIDESRALKTLREKTKELGLTVERSVIANMTMDKIVVPDEAIQAIVKTVRLNDDVQQEVVDKMVDRTPDYFNLPAQEQADKIKVTLMMETVIEFLRLAEFIEENITMVETGINNDGHIEITAYYVVTDEISAKVFGAEMTEEEVNRVEQEINVFDTDIDIYAEAKKRVEAMGKVVPFQNREQRRQAKKRKAVQI